MSFLEALYIWPTKLDTEQQMKFLVDSQALRKQLQTLSGVLNNSNTLPILDNFLFEIASSKLTISASDLETTMTTTMDIEANEDGVIAVPARMLLDTLKEFPQQPLTFTINPETFGVEISSDYGKYKLTGFNGDEFPKAPSVEGSSVQLDTDILARAIARTLFATGNDDLRPTMSGIFFEFYTDNLKFVATDAHRLVRYGRTDSKAENSAQFIVPKKPLNLLKGSLGAVDGNVKLSYTESNAYFTYDNITLMCRLIEGQYPNYEAVIPKENPNKLTIGRNDFLRSIRRVSIFSNKTTHQVRLKITGSELSISAEDLDFANEAVERLTCNYDGTDIEIGFNSRFLMDMLNNLSSEEITLEMSEPNRAGIIRPATPEEAGEELLMLVMPVMLNK